MTTTIVGVFQNENQAQTAVNELRNAGIPLENISVIARTSGEIVNERGETLTVNEDHMTAGEGLTVGAVWGGLVGLAALAIPGIGPLITTSALAAALTGAVAGAATGGIAGALINAASVPEEQARIYEDRVRAGSTLVTVQTDDTMAPRARTILFNAGAERFDWDGDVETDSALHTDAEDHYAASSKVGTVGGGTAGAVTGAAMGAAGGPVGAVIGGVAGAVVGGTVGAAGDTAGEMAEHETLSDHRDHTDRNVHDRVTSINDRSTEPMSDAERAYDESSKVGTVGGGTAGAVTGAAAGSVGGPVGAVIGGVTGAVVGGAVGAAGDTAGEMAEERAGYDNDRPYDNDRTVGDRLRDAGNSVERRLDADIDRDGDVGKRH